MVMNSRYAYERLGLQMIFSRIHTTTVFIKFEIMSSSSIISRPRFNKSIDELWNWKHKTKSLHKHRHLRPGVPNLGVGTTWGVRRKSRGVRLVSWK